MHCRHPTPDPLPPSVCTPDLLDPKEGIWDPWGMQNGGRVGNLFFHRQTEKLGQASKLGSTAAKPGLPLQNSGGLCSGQLLPGHLTCQLLGKCCC